MNVRESVSRACKSYKLILALESHGRRLRIDPDTVLGAGQLCEFAACFADRDWELLANIARVNAPSDDTKTQVLLMLKARQQYLYEREPVKSCLYSERPGVVEVVSNG